MPIDYLDIASAVVVVDRKPVGRHRQAAVVVAGGNLLEPIDNYLEQHCSSQQHSDCMALPAAVAVAPLDTMHHNHWQYPEKSIASAYKLQ